MLSEKSTDFAMQTAALKNSLIALGLNENEAAVYMAALSTGASTVLNIARAADIKRTTTYTVIESLMSKGLMRIDVQGFKRRYSAEPPEKLSAILEERQALFSKILPELNALHRLQGEESLIKFYQGKDGTKEVYEGLLRDVRSGEDYLVVSDQSLWYGLDPEFFEGFMRRRAKLKINIRLLLIDNPIAREYQKKQHVYNEEIRILPKTTALTTNLVVIPKKVVIHQVVPPIFAMVIENKSVVQMCQELFRVIWDTAQADS